MDALIYSGLSRSIHPVIAFIINVYVYFFVASAPTFSEARDCWFSVAVSAFAMADDMTFEEPMAKVAMYASMKNTSHFLGFLTFPIP